MDGSSPGGAAGAPGPHPVAEPEIHPVLRAAFRALDAHGIRWALLRGADDLALPSGDVDLLVDPAALDRLDGALAEAGLRRLGVRGHGSHRFYFSYDVARAEWLEVDVVTDVTFGPYQELRTGLARQCLEDRRRSGLVWRLCPEDEAWLLLLHLVLDKGRLAPERRASAQEASLRAPLEHPAPRTLNTCTRAGASAGVIALVQQMDDAAFVREARALRRRWRRRDPARAVSRSLVNRVLRSLDLPLREHPGGRIVAFIGPDGAGKSTVARAVRTSFPGSSRAVHLGVWRQGRWDRVVHRLPGGRPVQRLMRVLVGTTSIRWHRHLGRLVVLDRSAHDVLLPGALGASLVARVVPWLLLQLSPPPDVVVVLDAPGDVMFARKGEHTVEVLERRRQAYLEMARDDPAFVVLDATRPPAHVARSAMAAVWERL